MDKKPSVFTVLGPEKSFVLGIVVTVLVVIVVGFFFLLSQRMNSSDSLANNNTTQVKSTSSRQTPPIPTANGDIKIQPVSDTDWVRGNRDAKISIIEFSDTECPFCKRLHPTMKKIIDEYGDDVQWIYRHFPLETHAKARKEAEAVECAGELGGNDSFWSYLDRVFEITPSNDGLDLALLPDIAEYVGLDRSEFEACLNSGKYAGKIEDHYQQALAAGGRGTPYSVLISGDQKIPLSGALPYEQIKATIDALLK